MYNIPRKLAILKIALPQATRAGAFKSGTICKEVTVEMQTDISLKAFGETLQYTRRIDPIRVTPRVLEVLF